MGLSTYLRANNYMFEGEGNNNYNIIAEALDLVVPLNIGTRHNAHRNIEISIPIATWHKGHEVDMFLWEVAGSPESDEYELNLTREEVGELALRARRIASNPYTEDGVDEKNLEWVVEQYLRLERALTDYLLDDRLSGWTLKVWRSY